jgi:uncharacterized DUF497 family protein
VESNWELTEFEFVEFVWNNEKARANRRKHRVDFEDAAQIFREPVVAQVQFKEGEDRWQAIGTAKGGEFVVVFTETEGTCRIISAWRADKRARKFYYEILSR